MELKNNNIVRNIFQKNKKCIINTDLDGLLSGMLLQHFLNWEIVGFSYCSGSNNDQLWLRENQNEITDCVFVDLPVFMKNVEVIDQHFVAYSKKSIDRYNSDNKLNPNIMKELVFKDDHGKSQYTNKYPFGTIHFILAILENIGIIDDTFIIDLNKKLEGFHLSDLILRADRVIGNTNQYTANCLEWADWLIDIGKNNTKNLFEIVKNDYRQRLTPEKRVEDKLKQLGCSSIDGECSNMFRDKNYLAIKEYFNYLSVVTELKPLNIFLLNDFNKLKGERLKVDDLKKEILSKSNPIFSYAFISSKILSVTYIDIENN